MPSYIQEFSKTQPISSEHLGQGLTKYMQEYSEQVLDVPLLKEYLPIVIANLLFTNSLDPKEFVLYNFDKGQESGEDEEASNIPMFEEYFSLLAYLLAQLKQKWSWSEIRKFFGRADLRSQLSKMQPFLLQDNILSEEGLGLGNIADLISQNDV